MRCGRSAHRSWAISRALRAYRPAGHFRPDRQFLLDNRSHAGEPGYEVLTPLELADGRALLVDRGWVAFTGSRAHLPDMSFAAAPVATVVGRVG